MLFCFDTSFVDAPIISHKIKSLFPPKPKPTNHHTAKINSKKFISKFTSNVPVTVSHFLCRSTLIFYVAEKLFSKKQHIIKRASPAILKLKMLLKYM